MEDTPVPPPRPILRCDHGEETHVKQFRYPYDRYTIVSIYFFHFNSIISIFTTHLLM
jgi:hypothetical protein